jgi:flavodoxin
MKSLITYFSYTEHTTKVVEILTKLLKQRGTVEVQRLVPKTPITKFFQQCFAARKQVRAELLEAPKVDNSDFDLIVIASPVWAYNPAPVFNTYFDAVQSFNGKNVVIVLVSGGRMFVRKCFAKIAAILQAKNAGQIAQVNIIDSQLNKEDEIIAQLGKAL